MNKRKAKKRRKQHESQICVETIARLPELAENVQHAIVDCIKQYCKIVHGFMDRIKTMPDDEFERFCDQLDPQQTALVRRIRMKGCDTNEREEQNT